jgi:hypothetical protein
LEKINKKNGFLTYQKGFTQSELVDYLQNVLGGGFTVKPLHGGNNYDVRAEIVKL